MTAATARRSGVQLLAKYSTSARHATCQVTRKYVEVQVPMPWGHVAGKWWGPLDKRPILCLHGWQESCGSFDPLVQHLPDDLGFLAIDLPGHGHSSRLPKGMFYHEVDAPVLVRRIQQYFHWPQVSFIAHSLGACTSFLFSALFPDDVDFVIELEGLKPFSATPGSAIPAAVKNVDRFLRYDKWSDAEAPAYTYDEIMGKLMEGSVFNESLQPHNARYVLDRTIGQSPLDPSKYIFTRDSRLKTRTLLAMQHSDICEYARRIKCPVVKIKATRGSTFEKAKFTDDILAIMNTNNTEFDVVHVEGTHHVHVNEPGKIADIVRQFLAKYDRADRSVGGGLKQGIIVSKL